MQAASVLWLALSLCGMMRKKILAARLIRPYLRTRRLPSELGTAERGGRACAIKLAPMACNPFKNLHLAQAVALIATQCNQAASRLIEQPSTAVLDSGVNRQLLV